MQEVKALLRKIDRHDKINTVLVFVIIVMIAVNNKAIERDIILSRNNQTEIGVIKGRQDVYRQQYLDYIKSTIEAINQFQQDNADPEAVKKRGVKVPKIPILHPPDKALSESDLARIPQPAVGPSPTPKIIEKTKTKRIYLKPKPTPKAIKWPWEKPSSTR